MAKRKVNENRLPKISIVVPVLNNEKYIAETLRSLVEQQYSNLEIIIQDGGSSDNTLKIAQKFSRKLNIKIYSQKDNGQYDALHRGFGKASGKIFAFINSDDMFAKGALKAVSESYINNKNALWFAGFGAVVDESGLEINTLVTSYKNTLHRLNNYNLLIMVNYLMQPSVFLSKEAYEKYGPFRGNKKFLREYDLWMKLGRIRMPVVIPKTLSYFRLSKEMISASKFREIAQDDLKTTKKYSSNQMLLALRWFHNFLRRFFLP